MDKAWRHRLAHEFECIRKQGMIRFLAMTMARPENLRPQDAHKPGRQGRIQEPERQLKGFRRSARRPSHSAAQVRVRQIQHSPAADVKLVAAARRFEQRLQKLRGENEVWVGPPQKAPLILMVEK
jgi:hypothetical protein